MHRYLYAEAPWLIRKPGIEQDEGAGWWVEIEDLPICPLHVYVNGASARSSFSNRTMLLPLVFPNNPNGYERKELTTNCTEQPKKTTKNKAFS